MVFFSSRRRHTRGASLTGVQTCALPFGVVCDPARIGVVDDPKISDQTRSSANAPYGSLGCDIWIYPVSGGKKKNLTEAKGSNWSPAWSPDGGKLAFHSDRDGVPGVWVWNSKADTVRKVSNLATRQSRGYEFPLWLDDNRILVKGVPADEKTAEAPSANILFAARPSEKVEGSTVSVFVSPTADRSRGEGHRPTGPETH